MNFWCRSTVHVRLSIDRIPDGDAQQTFRQNMWLELERPRHQFLDAGTTEKLTRCLAFLGRDLFQGALDVEQSVTSVEALRRGRAGLPLRDGQGLQRLRKFSAQMFLIREVI